MTTRTITRARLAEFVAWARARDGLPYEYGGAFDASGRASTDCSGLVLSTAAFFQGMDPHRRYGSTESFRLRDPVVFQLGFAPGPGGEEHFFKVGLLHGGGGPASHTACTVAGANWESSGSHGVRYGPGARGWDDPMFTDHWHYDAVLEPEAALFLPSLSPRERRVVLDGFSQFVPPRTDQPPPVADIGQPTSFTGGSS